MSTASTDGRRGMEVLRRLDADERRLLQAAFDGCAPEMPRTREIHWVNLYLNGEPTLQHPQREPLHAWVTRTVAEVYADWPEVHLLAYGFIVNPAGNPDSQPFHCDYSLSSSNLFVPLTRVSLLNATQFIRQPLARARYDANITFGSVEEMLEQEDCDAIEVTQLVCRPFSLVRLLPGTPHRGIPNGDAHDRVMFFCTLDQRPRALAEAVYFRYSTRVYEPVTPRDGDAEPRR